MAAAAGASGRLARLQMGRPGHRRVADVTVAVDSGTIRDGAAWGPQIALHAEVVNLVADLRVEGTPGQLYPSPAIAGLTRVFQVWRSWQ